MKLKKGLDHDVSAGTIMSVCCLFAKPFAFSGLRKPVTATIAIATAASYTHGLISGGGYKAGKASFFCFLRVG